MPKVEDLLKNGTSLGVAIGLGAAVIAAAIVPALPVIARAGRPAARSAIKQGLALVERGREVMAEAGEELEDLLAEVREELRQERKAHSSNAGEAEVVLDREE